jgi:two-component system chemotaxis response regulator CheB
VTAVGVVVADRSATVRTVLRRVLGGSGAIEVVGETDDGREVVELVRRTDPGCLVTDLDLVGLGGFELVEAVAQVRQIPIVALIPAIRSDSTRVAFASHGLGVIAVYPKPHQPEGWAELGRMLESSILEACGQTRIDSTVADHPDEVPVVRRGLRFVAVGSSTGGPGALFEMLRALGGSAGIGVAVVQHIAAGFERVLAEWLAAETGLDVAIARHGEHLSPCSVRFAPAGGHLRLAKDGVLHVDRSSPPVNGHKPSVDVLFRSLSDHLPGTAAAVLLSGMGSDGAEAMMTLRRGNVLTIAQDPVSCAVFGMPRVAIEMGAVTFTLAPAQIGRLLVHADGSFR